MKATLKQIVRTAREFPNSDDGEVLDIARIRTEREANPPYNPNADTDPFEYRAQLLGLGKYSLKNILQRAGVNVEG